MARAPARPDWDGAMSDMQDCAYKKLRKVERSVNFACNKLVFGKPEVIIMAFRIVGRVLLTPLLLVTFLGYVGAACLAGWALNHNLDSPNAIGKYDWIIKERERESERESFIRSCLQFDLRSLIELLHHQVSLICMLLPNGHDENVLLTCSASAYESWRLPILQYLGDHWSFNTHLDLATHI